MSGRFPLPIVWLSAIIASLLTACANNLPPTESELVEFEIPYLTTRAVKIDRNGRTRYSTKVAGISAGVCAMTQVMGGELDADIYDYRMQTIDDVLSSLHTSRDEDLLVYIHGYNTGLERACREAANVAFRTGFEGRLLLFSWPASRAVLTYRKDRRRLEESNEAIIDSLRVLAERFGGSNVNVIAHSMGSTAIAANDEASRIGLESLGDLILIAPDIDPESFIESLPMLKERFRDISVLASDSDHILLLSQTINLAPRLGRLTELNIAGVKVVNVSDIGDLGDHGLGNHLYHLESDSVADILRMILSD